MTGNVFFFNGSNLFGLSIDGEINPLDQKVDFTLEIPQEMVRSMKREEYYEVKSWLRNVRRVMQEDAGK